MLIEREIKADIIKNLFKGKGVIIYGPRRVGKTTLAKDIISKYGNDARYINCDILENRQALAIQDDNKLREFLGKGKIFVIDEAQNLSMHELKTIITRVGEGTKIVLTGDIEQIDNLNVDVYTNGLTYAVERFKEHDVAGHVTLIKGERSALATLASKIL